MTRPRSRTTIDRSRTSTLRRRQSTPLTTASRWLVVGAVLGAIALGPMSPVGADPIGPPIPQTTPTAATVPTKKPSAPARKKSAPRKSTTKSNSRSKSPTAKTSASPVNTGPAAVGKNAGGFGQGSQGDKVLALQQRLQELKYDVTDPDGKYGGQTYHAIMAFQKVNGLARTGRANEATLAAMKTATEPAPRVPGGGPDRVEINIPGQYLSLYRDGALVRILSISTGSGKEFCVLDPDTKKTECDVALTPGGSFRIQSRIIGWRESKLGLMYNPLYFNGGIAIHGAPSVPGYPASHGCVRIPMVSAEWFYQEAFDGIPVYVFGAKDAPVPLGAKAPTDTQSKATTTKAGAPTTTGIVGTIPGTTVAGGTTVASISTTTTPGATVPGSTVPGSTSGSTTSSSTSTTSTSSTSTTTTTGLIRLLPTTTPPT